MNKKIIASPRSIRNLINSPASAFLNSYLTLALLIFTAGYVIYNLEDRDSSLSIGTHLMSLVGFMGLSHYWFREMDYRSMPHHPQNN